MAKKTRVMIAVTKSVKERVNFQIMEAGNANTDFFYYNSVYRIVTMLKSLKEKKEKLPDVIILQWQSMRKIRSDWELLSIKENFPKIIVISVVITSKSDLLNSILNMKTNPINFKL